MVFYKKFLMIAVLGVSLTQMVVATDVEEDVQGGTEAKKTVSFASGNSDLPPIVDDKKGDSKPYVQATMAGIHAAGQFFDGHVPTSCQSLTRGAAGMAMTALSIQQVQRVVEGAGPYVVKAAETLDPYVQAAATRAQPLIKKAQPKVEAVLAYAQPLALRARDEAGSAYGRWTQRKSTVRFAMSETAGWLNWSIDCLKSFLPLTKQKA